MENGKISKRRQDAHLTLPNWVKTYFQTAFQSNPSNDGRPANRQPAESVVQHTQPME